MQNDPHAMFQELLLQCNTSSEHFRKVRFYRFAQHDFEGHFYENGRQSCTRQTKFSDTLSDKPVPNLGYAVRK
jgi:hypothetical protein